MIRVIHYMVTYILEFCVIIVITLPFYLILRSPWHRDPRREAALAVFVLFMAGLLALALRGTYQAPGRMLETAAYRLKSGDRINLIPFRSIYAYFTHYGLDAFLVNFVGNIVMFMPWGFGMTLLWKKLQNPGIVILCSLALTAFIETAQLFIGRSVDVDDLILNFAGSCLGAGICCILRKKFPKLAEIAI